MILWSDILLTLSNKHLFTHFEECQTCDGVDKEGQMYNISKISWNISETNMCFFRCTSRATSRVVLINTVLERLSRSIRSQATFFKLAYSSTNFDDNRNSVSNNEQNLSVPYRFAKWYFAPVYSQTLCYSHVSSMSASLGRVGIIVRLLLAPLLRGMQICRISKGGEKLTRQKCEVETSKETEEFDVGAVLKEREGRRQSHYRSSAKWNGRRLIWCL